MKDLPVRSSTAQSEPAASTADRAATTTSSGPIAGESAVQLEVARSPRMLAQRRSIQAVLGSTRRESDAPEGATPLQARLPQPNQTGMPNQLKAGIESLSGMDMSAVRVHRNSAKPAQLNALAYAQGNNIHLGPGQEQHLPHEAWHLVQQRQGRVQATRQMTGVGVNDDPGLEREADSMGARAVLQGAGLNVAQRNACAPQQTLSPTGSAIVQAKGSGGQKIGFEFRGNPGNDENIAAGIRLVKESWAEAKAARHDQKTTWMGTNIQGEKFKGSGSATTKYAESLDDIAEEKDLFLGKLKPGLTHAPDTNVITYRIDGMAAPVEVATLQIGGGAFTKNADEPGRRSTFHKKGMKADKTQAGDAKEYIEDNLGVKTRRFAYVEKNYYQMMDFFKTEKMTGRFQQYMQAGGATVGPEKSTAKARTEVVKGGGSADLNPTQIAVAHQMLGSSPEQRGVSLTSTEKVGATVGNAGKNFREKDGFKLKIDLAKVPAEVLLINHYSDHGLITEDLGAKNVKGVTTTVSNPPSKPYKYGGSVRKNRELYLEHIKPEWVVEIEHHPEGGYGTASGAKTPSTGLASFQETAKIYAKYWEAFDKTLKGDPVDAPTPAETKGIGSANLVKEGFAEGNVKRPAVTASVAHEEVSDPALKDKFSQWHLGYIRGRVGKPNFTDAAQYAEEMKKVN